MGLVDYISRQLNQQPKVTNNYDEEFAVATIIRIRDAIAAICVNTTPQNCQSEHFSSVNHTHSTPASNPHSTNRSKFFSALNHNTTQLLLFNTANAAQFQVNNNSNMSSPRTNPQTPPTSAPSRVTLQSTPNSAVNSTRSSNDGQASPILELSGGSLWEYFNAITHQRLPGSAEQQGCSLEGGERLYSTEWCPEVQGIESLPLIILQGFTRQFRDCLRWRTRGNTTFNTRCSTWVSPHDSSRQLGYDYPRPICILALHA